MEKAILQPSYIAVRLIVVVCTCVTSARKRGAHSLGCIVPLIAVPDVIATGFIKQPKQLPAIQADDELLDEVKHVIRSLSVEEPIIRLVIYIVMILGHSNPLPLLEKSDGGSYTWSMHSTNKSKPKRPQEFPHTFGSRL